eukprot:scaffold100790_cov30-Tisochrysis_lutea.AAC.1
MCPRPGASLACTRVASSSFDAIKRAYAPTEGSDVRMEDHSVGSRPYRARSASEITKTKRSSASRLATLSMARRVASNVLSPEWQNCVCTSILLRSERRAVSPCKGME